MPAKEYCAVRTTEVKASSRGGHSRKGAEQKPKKAHSRTSCYATGDASLNSDQCVHSAATNRCVKVSKNMDKAEARRARSRSRSAAQRAAKRSEPVELLPNPGLEGGRQQRRSRQQQQRRSRQQQQRQQQQRQQQQWW